ncbi:hypothetical protein [uncultured Roseibium sp.]|uniref:hypothetical protein n=1 Tax=uncultured Roseibium sp. TaxID=1936171 RepID=UPI0032166A06
MLGNPFFRARVSAAAAAMTLCMVLTAVSGPVKAQDDEDGWVSDFEGLRHFSGMRCPDVVGGFLRSKALGADSDRMAGCIYSGEDGMTAVLRQHLLGTGSTEARKYMKNYKAAGFREIALTGVAQSGISFVTRDWTQATQCETLWHFSGKKADYTLWLTYSLPGQETVVGPAVAAFTKTLNRQN